MRAVRTLFVAWQAGDSSRAWFPIGRLDAEAAEDEYVFRCTRGALHACGRARTRRGEPEPRTHPHPRSRAASAVAFCAVSA